MKILGFYIGGHDSNVSMVDENGNVTYFKYERITQSKHKKGSIQWVKDLCTDRGFLPDVVCFSDGNRNQLGICGETELFTETGPIDGLYDVETYCMDHHYGHILSAWPLIGKEEEREYKSGICVDGRGDHQMKCSVIRNPFNVEQAELIYGNKEQALCLLFNKIGKMMNLSGGELDYAGKIMGAHSYGKIDFNYIKTVDQSMQAEGIDIVLRLAFRGKQPEKICRQMDPVFYDWLASVHFLVMREIETIFSQYHLGKTVYSGGGAQNTVINEYLSKKYQILIPPHCYDGGISLGCVKFAACRNNVKLNIPNFPFVQGESDLGYAETETIKRAVQLLCEGKIVGWCQGKGEIGPRALGHRSILMNPAIKNGKDIINSRVKKREYWRPFAASILQEDAGLIMGENRQCNYMLHAVKVEEAYQERLASVVHADGTCRFQTVEDTPALHSYYQLIECFKKNSGVPGILNTSYNFAGKPIADSYDDVIEVFENMDIDALCVGNVILTREEVEDGRVSVRKR